MHTRKLVSTTYPTLKKICRLSFCRQCLEMGLRNFITGMMVHLHLLLPLWYTLYEPNVHGLEDKLVEEG